MSTSRQDHLKWCKDRALPYVEAGDLKNAWMSFCSDMGKHTGTADHGALYLGQTMFVGGLLNTKEEMKKFINDFN